MRVRLWEEGNCGGPWRKGPGQALSFGSGDLWLPSWICFRGTTCLSLYACFKKFTTDSSLSRRMPRCRRLGGGSACAIVPPLLGLIPACPAQAKLDVSPRRPFSPTETLSSALCCFAEAALSFPSGPSRESDAYLVLCAKYHAKLLYSAGH